MPWTTGEMAGAGAAGAGALGYLMGTAGNGYSAAENPLQKYYSQGINTLSPYATAGTNAAGNLQTAAGNLMDPTQMQADWINSYTESPQARATQAMATQQGLGAASSMGLMGSSAAMQGLQQGTSDIGFADRQNYLNQLMQKYQLGVGINQNLFNTGEQAAGNMGQLDANEADQMANMEYGKASAGNSMLSGLLGTAAGVVGSIYGGPVGGAIGSKVGSAAGNAL